ncbi:MAG: carbamoyltransferase [Candidatus Azotimanducaceae bacterium]|jgi:carbamoyltransferase
MNESTNIIGISAYYHDSAAALIVDGTIIAAAQEERFTRKKHDPCFPQQAIQYCLDEGKVSLAEIDHIIFYDKPLIKFERLLETYLSYAPKGIRSFLAAMPVWLQEKLFLKQELRMALSKMSGIEKKHLPPLLFNEHHQSHAASAFFPSPYQKAAVLCLDGVGEWATSSVWLGDGNKLTSLWEIDFPHSLGLLYSAFTYYTGFKVNSGEYKLMGLAPYGEPIYAERILDNLLDVKDDGSFHLDMSYFDFATGLRMTNKKFEQLFDGPARAPESEVSQKEMNIARSIQLVTEEIVLKLAHNIFKEVEVDYLCLAGGVALNCVSNGRLLREGPFKNIWIQPAAGDAGGALGAALSVWHEYLNKPRQADNCIDQMKGAYLGKAFSLQEISTSLDALGASYQILEDPDFYPEVAKLLGEGKVVGWFSGRMEFGPRALGNRSILGDPRNTKMQSVMNLRIKYRESFRPFAPAIKASAVSDWFEIDRASPYMLLVADVKKNKRMEMSADEEALFGIEKLHVARSEIPAVTHVDYSARLQTIHEETNPRFHKLIEQFEQQTGCPILINTSFNVRGEPIVYSPEDAYQCFMHTDMDVLVLENVILLKPDQKSQAKDDSWQKTFELD